MKKVKEIGRAKLQALILDEIYNEYKGNPRKLARDSGACQRSASYWLAGEHIMGSNFILNLAINNKNMEKALLTDLVNKLRAAKGLPPFRDRDG